MARPDSWFIVAAVSKTEPVMVVDGLEGEPDADSIRELHVGDGDIFKVNLIVRAGKHDPEDHPFYVEYADMHSNEVLRLMRRGSRKVTMGRIVADQR